MKEFSFSDFMNQKKPLSHIMFLLFSMFVLFIVAVSGKMDHSFSSLSGAFILIVCQMEAFIFFGNILFSKINFDQSPGVITRTIILRFAVFILVCFFVAMILFLMLHYATLRINGESTSDLLFNFIHEGFGPWFRSVAAGLSAGAVIFGFLLWQTSLRREQKLREENLIFQNQTLKAQVNPHFLFNNLNTLSSLITTDPEVAEKFLNRLSSIYRYILENSHNSKVPLNSELTFIRDYFDLYKIRDEDKISLSVDVPGSERFLIIPVSLQILMENAIKHNMATREKPLKIQIYIEHQSIVVRNNLQKMSAPLKSTGIGLKNLAERVSLLTGKDLVIEESNSEFIVKVPLFS